MQINDSPSVEWSKKAYVFNPHARGLVLSEESEENILVNLHGLLGEPDAVQIEIASENLEEGSQFVYDNVAYQVTRTIMEDCLLYTSPSPRDGLLSRMPSSA